MNSIKDVAAHAGVSVKTVSRILNGYKGVSPKTVEKVNKAMKELEYYPSAAAQALKGVGAGIVSLITDNLTTTPYSYGIVAGIQDVCEKQGLLLMIGETGGSMDNFSKLVDDFRRQRSQAIILATVYHKEVKITQAFKQCPLILVNCFEKETIHPTILPDDEKGAFDATSHLIEKGHKRIASLTLFEEMVATNLRLRGYKAAHKHYKIPVDNHLIRRGVFKNENDEFVDLEIVLRELLALPNPPTAIMCGNDKMAMRVFMLIRGVMGYKIPEQISIVGYDNYQMIAENLVPQLSTVTLPYFSMGQLAATLAISKEHSAKVHQVSGKFVERLSVLNKKT
ncbi:LacI family DNA-binding transcriptional regulator [Colwellia sp. E150_009]